MSFYFINLSRYQWKKNLPNLYSKLSNWAGYWGLKLWPPHHSFCHVFSSEIAQKNIIKHSNKKTSFVTVFRRFIQFFPKTKPSNISLSARNTVKSLPGSSLVRISGMCLQWQPIPHICQASSSVTRFRTNGSNLPAWRPLLVMRNTLQNKLLIIQRKQYLNYRVSE